MFPGSHVVKDPNITTTSRELAMGRWDRFDLAISNEFCRDGSPFGYSFLDCSEETCSAVLPSTPCQRRTTGRATLLTTHSCDPLGDAFPRSQDTELSDGVLIEELRYKLSGILKCEKEPTGSQILLQHAFAQIQNQDQMSNDSTLHRSRVMQRPFTLPSAKSLSVKIITNLLLFVASSRPRTAPARLPPSSSRTTSQLRLYVASQAYPLSFVPEAPLFVCEAFCFGWLVLSVVTSAAWTVVPLLDCFFAAAGRKSASSDMGSSASDPEDPS